MTTNEVIEKVNEMVPANGAVSFSFMDQRVAGFVLDLKFRIVRVWLARSRMIDCVYDSERRCVRFIRRQSEYNRQHYGRLEVVLGEHYRAN